MLSRLIEWLEKKLDENSAHKRNVGAETSAQPEGYGTVLRFQGQYDCGHPWPLDKLAPENCPVHGEGCNRVYAEDGRVEFDRIHVEAVGE